MAPRAEAATPLLFSNRSHVGRVRQENEDYLGYFRSGGRHLFVVADGMGGEVGGKEASRGAVAAVQAIFEADPHREPLALLAHAMREANEHCLQLQEGYPELEGLGTTLEIVLVERDKAWWAHVGDSRIYHLRNGEARQLTRDHTLVRQMIEDGLLDREDATDHPRRHVLSRVVGHDAGLQPDLSSRPVHLNEGDSILLCSDGLTDVVNDDELAWIVDRYGPQRACERLVELANERGGNDNVTVQVVHRGQPRRGWRRMTTRIPSTLVPPRLRRKRRWLAAAAVLAGLGALAYMVTTPRPEESVMSPASSPADSDDDRQTGATGGGVELRGSETFTPTHVRAGAADGRFSRDTLFGPLRVTLPVEPGAAGPLVYEPGSFPGEAEILQLAWSQLSGDPAHRLRIAAEGPSELRIGCPVEGPGKTARFAASGPITIVLGARSGTVESSGRTTPIEGVATWVGTGCRPELVLTARGDTEPASHFELRGIEMTLLAGAEETEGGAPRSATPGEGVGAPQTPSGPESRSDSEDPRLLADPITDLDRAPGR